MLVLSYPGGDYRTVFQVFADYLQTPAVGNRLTMPAWFGKGSFELIDLPMGIQAWLSDFDIADDLYLVRRRSEQDLINFRFDVLESSDTQLLVNDAAVDRLTAQAFAFVNHSRVGIAYHAKRNAKAKSLNLLFTPTTLRALLPTVAAFDAVNDRIANPFSEDQQRPFFVAADAGMVALLKELFGLSADDPHRPLKFFNRALQLLEDYIRLLPQQPQAGGRSVSKPDYESMLELEATITSDFRNALPPQEELATKAYMSVSKLKYTFKSVFGTSLYEHYQKMRMQKAIELLQTGQPLAEIAHQLGFSDPASFTRNFKKEFNLPPSKIRQLGRAGYTDAGTVSRI